MKDPGVPSPAAVVRPIVRSFSARYLREAARHVRAGGHAVVWSSASKAMVVIPKPDAHRADDLGKWALLDMGRQTWTTESAGVLAGLATARVPRASLDLVRERAERDSVHPGPTRTMHLDCLACAACCRHNVVTLERADLRRFRGADKEALTRPPFTRKAGAKIVLRLLRSGDCRHLQADLRCAIYELRPGACRTFPPGSEGCLFAREEELGIVDGA